MVPMRKLVRVLSKPQNGIKSAKLPLIELDQRISWGG
jgi:hypothetical protein